MSSNPFAALDDSGDEAPKTKAVEKKAAKPKPPKVAEPSKVDQRRRPNNHDRNTKYGRGGRAPARDGKRAYDRRSGTGRGRETKKGGGGAHNWGSDKNEARQNEGHVEEGALEEEPSTNKEDETENNGESGAGGEGANGEEEQAPEQEPEPEPEEDKTMSYEEYMATKTNIDNEAFAPVKEREVSNDFAGLKVRGKKEDEEEDFLVMGGGKQKKNKQKKGNQKQSITPDFRVAGGDYDRRRDGGGRGGRGGRGRGGGGGRYDGRGGRGGRGRGRDGGGRGRGGGGDGGGDTGGGDINVMDESAFPSL